MRRGTLTLRARYVFPVEGRRSRTVPDDRARADRLARARRRATADLDLGNVAIVPGFVNAHTHLELEPLAGESAVDQGAEDEIAWLRQVIEQRARPSDARNRATAVPQNVRAAIEAGTTLPGRHHDGRAELGADRRGAAARRGLRRADRPEARPRARDQRSRLEVARVGPPRDAGGRLRAGRASARTRPTAPRAGSITRRSPAGCRSRPTWRRCPRSCELLEHRDGPLRRFLEDIGAWDEEWEPIGPRPADYVRRGELRNADWLIAHGTYLEPDDFWQLRPRPRRTASGSPSPFAPDPRPLRPRAASLPRPARTRRDRLSGHRQPGVQPRASASSTRCVSSTAATSRSPARCLLTMATLFGAWALRAETTTGSLKAGKSADLAVVALPDRDEADPYRLVLESDLPVDGTVFEGDFVAGRWDGPRLRSGRPRPAGRSRWWASRQPPASARDRSRWPPTRSSCTPRPARPAGPPRARRHEPRAPPCPGRTGPGRTARRSPGAGR